jgi:hypothetical protein
MVLDEEYSGKHPPPMGSAFATLPVTDDGDEVREAPTGSRIDIPSGAVGPFAIMARARATAAKIKAPQSKGGRPKGVKPRAEGSRLGGCVVEVAHSCFD